MNSAHILIGLRKKSDGSREKREKKSHVYIHFRREYNIFQNAHLIKFARTRSPLALFIYPLFETARKIDLLGIFWIARPGGLRVDFREPVLGALRRQSYRPKLCSACANLCVPRASSALLIYEYLRRGGFEAGTDTLLQNGLGNIY